MRDGITRDIPDDENLVRGVFTPYHFDTKKNKLKTKAFIQKPHSKGVSSYRTAILDVNEYRDHAKKLSKPDQKKEYFGLVVVSAHAVRVNGARVEDTRETNFYGHADIFHDIPDALPQEPNEPEDIEKLEERINKILECAVFYKDPDPSNQYWLGTEPLMPTC